MRQSKARRGVRRTWAGQLGVLFLVMICARIAGAQSAEQGRSLFFEVKKCNICHTIGGGKAIGPDLQGVVERREHDWLVRHIVEPDKMIAEMDPIVMQLLKEHNNAVMPVFGLNEEQAESIIAFLANPNTEGGAAPGQAVDSTIVPFSVASILPDTDEAQIVATGRDYFTGRRRFSGGAPPCVSCHHVTQSGLFGGGTLGPDLTPAVQKFTEAGLASLLESVPYPTMSPIFIQKPLTTEETAFVIGYLKAKGAQTSLPVGVNISLFIVLVFILLIFVAPMIWQNRLGPVRKRLLRGN